MNSGFWGWLSVESQPQNAEFVRSNSFSDLFSVCLRTFDHLNLKLWIISGHTANFKIGVSKVQDLGNFEGSPMHIFRWAYCKYQLALLSRLITDDNVCVWSPMLLWVSLKCLISSIFSTISEPWIFSCFKCYCWLMANDKKKWRKPQNPCPAEAYILFVFYLSIYLPIHLNPRGGRQTGIPEYQVLRGLVEIKW